MQKYTYDFLINELKLKKSIIDMVQNCETTLDKEFKKTNEIREFNQYKILNIMKENRLSDIHFNSTTGYGYGDIGRDVLDKIFAGIFGCEDAMVRTNIISGTHALSICLFGLLFPGDEMLSITGKPYETLDNVIGIEKRVPGSLRDYGVSYKQIDLTKYGEFKYDEIKRGISDKTRLVFLQRSAGYNWRQALTIDEMDKIISFAKSIKPNVYVMVDNCYGEFTEVKEPTEAGADIVAGSLIKNPGGSIAPAGGYVAGKKELVGLAAGRLMAPGLGKEGGATLGNNRLLIQGLFMAPHIVSEALKGAILCSKIFSELGYEVRPAFNSNRSDIIQAIRFEKGEALISFCQGIQKGSPVDSFVMPEPWDMPGYNEQVIMAAGGFVQGSSIELSADGPIKPPYTAFLQGGVTYDHVKIALMYALEKLESDSIISI